MPAVCPPPDLIARYLDDRLADADSAGLETHLSSCAACEGRLRLALRGDPLLPLARSGGSAWSVPKVLRERLIGLCAAPDTDGTRPQETPPVVGLRGAPELVGLLRPAQAPDELGRLGQYRVLKVLGKGGMGVVCLAEHLHLGNRVAVKLIRPGMTADPRAAAFFVRESRAVAALSHEHVVTVYDGGQDGDVLFLAMELLEGQTVSTWMTEKPRRPLREVLRTAREAATGLAFAHSKGIVHRDFKPANLWRCADRGRIKLLDFGLARDPSAQTLTEPGQVYGTLPYMAPEQAQGKPADARADLFSLGVVLHELCSDVSPFARPNQLNVLTALVEYHPDPLSGLYPWLPSDLVSLTRDLLAKDPAARVPSANEVVARLRRIEDEAGRGGMLDRLVGQPEAEPAAPAETPSAPVLLATPVVRPEPLAAPQKRWPLAAGLAFGLLVAAGIGMLLRDTKLESGVLSEAISASLRSAPPTNGVNGNASGSITPPPAPGVPPAWWSPGEQPKLKLGDPLSSKCPTRTPMIYKDKGILGWTFETDRQREFGYAMAIAPDGKLLATGSLDGTVRIYETQTWKLTKAFVPPHPVNQMVWSRDGKWLFTTGDIPQEPTLAWDTSAGRIVHQFSTHLYSPTVSSDGKYLAGTVEGTKVVVESLDKKAPPITLSLPNTQPSSLGWKPDSGLLAVGYYDGEMRFWETKKWSSAGTLKSGLDAVVQYIGWSSDGKRLAAGSQHGVAIWQDEKRTQFNEANSGTAWSPVADALAVIRHTSAGCAVREPSLPGDKFKSEFKLPSVRSVHWFPDGKRLGFVRNEGVTVTDAAGKEVHSLLIEATLRFDPEKGNYRPNPKAANPIFIVLTDKGQETLTPDEFAKRTGWKNDPDAVLIP